MKINNKILFLQFMHKHTHIFSLLINNLRIMNKLYTEI